LARSKLHKGWLGNGFVWRQHLTAVQPSHKQFPLVLFFLLRGVLQEALVTDLQNSPKLPLTLARAPWNGPPLKVMWCFSSFRARLAQERVVAGLKEGTPQLDLLVRSGPFWIR